MKTKNDIFTVEYLKKNFDSVHKAYEYFRTLQKSYKHITRPISPNSNASSSVYLDYANKLIEYEKQKEINDKEIKEIRLYNDNLDSIFEEYIKDMAGLNTIPEQYKSKVYSLAYSNGHSGGYVKIYNELLNLIEIFD